MQCGNLGHALELLTEAMVLGLAGGTIGLGLSLCILYGLLLGYPPRRFTTRLLNRKEQAVVAACAEALFPARDPMPLTGIEAGIVEYFDGHLLKLPAD